ncbi:hypothetical protein MCOR02_006607 [Pyricularia oryzae]|nr:hypothetical protein MCOR02_006607 [Pyricularia oryzae]KAI6261174.1 hypothetical protein MCOR19_002597 [Pyricularia oryzae]KAI6313291.1 hypothetical protein MCOR29_007747 [Pyricularia oryzae]KAI6433139.1 hypothetical protein MCOR24_001361 [Pyricularia oryzae]KAI6436842.1 hypothetical protein MCOR21_000825 [Pyricularia oryzae]
MERIRGLDFKRDNYVTKSRNRSISPTRRARRGDQCDLDTLQDLFDRDDNGSHGGSTTDWEQEQEDYGSSWDTLVEDEREQESRGRSRTRKRGREMNSLSPEMHPATAGAGYEGGIDELEGNGRIHKNNDLAQQATNIRKL